MNIASRDCSLWNEPIFNKLPFHAAEETRDLICASWCGIHSVVFPTLFQMSLPHRQAKTPSTFLLDLAGFPKHTSHAPGSQPAYLSEKNRPAFPCRTLTSEDDNPLARNISNNCLENRCLSSFACNQLSLLPPFPAWPSMATGMLPLPVTHHSIFSHRWKTGTGEIPTHVRGMGAWHFLSNKYPNLFANCWGKPGGWRCGALC